MKHKRLIPILMLVLMSIASTRVAAQQGAGVAEAVDSTKSGWVADVLHWYDANMNYLAVGGLMTLESSFIPFPSEVVIPPAVYVALDEQSQSGMNWWLVVVFGTLGALLGALINYFLSMWLGRPIIYAFADSKLGHLLQLSREKMERAEVYFNKHGVVSTLVGRFIPVIRQLISIPAGLARMNLGAFMLYTTIGAFAWNCVLALLGYLAHLAGDISVVEKYSDEISWIIIGLLIVAIVAFVIYRLMKQRSNGKRGIGIVFALLFGTIGLHHFYTGDKRHGILHIVFCWTGIPTLLGIGEGVWWMIDKNAYGKPLITI